MNGIPIQDQPCDRERWKCRRPRKNKNRVACRL